MVGPDVRIAPHDIAIPVDTQSNWPIGWHSDLACPNLKLSEVSPLSLVRLTHQRWRNDRSTLMYVRNSQDRPWALGPGNGYDVPTGVVRSRGAELPVHASYHD